MTAKHLAHYIGWLYPHPIRARRRLFLCCCLLIVLLFTLGGCGRGREAPPAATLPPTSTGTAVATPSPQPTNGASPSTPTAVDRPLATSVQALRYDPVELAPNFSAIDQQRQVVELADLRGNLVLLYFGFINCPDACPLTLADWQLVHRQLGDAADNVRFVFMTVDPERDSPEIMAQYLAAFDEDFIGLWAELDEVEAIARDYNVFMEQVPVDSALGYVVNHTTLTFLIDQAGQLVVAYPVDASADEITADLKQLLADPPPMAIAPTNSPSPVAASSAVTSTAVTSTVVAPVSSELHATDPATVNLVAGRPQFVELFAFW